MNNRRREPVWEAVWLVLAISAVLTAAFGPWRRSSPLDDGIRLESEGQYVPAARALAQAVAQSPRDARAHHYLGLAYGQIGRRDAAMDHLEEAVRLNPTNARYRSALGEAYRSAGDTARALDEFEQAARRAPQYQIAVAGTLLEQGREPEAVATLRQAERAAPTSADIRLLLADALERAGDRDAMQRECREVIRLADGTALAELARQKLHDAGTEGHRP